MTTNLIEDFVKYLGERHFNAASLLSKLNSAPRRNGENTLRDLWEASDLSANDFAEDVAQFYRLSRVGLPQLIAAPTLAAKFSRRFLRETLVFPYQGADGSCRLVLADPTDVAAVRAAEIVLGRPVEIEIGSYEDIATVLAKRLGEDDDASPEGDEATSARADDDVESLRDLASGAPVVRAVNDLLERAMEVRATDIHIEPFRNGLVVRMRVDGLLRAVPTPAGVLPAALISRIKILAGLNIAERRLPQDGRIQKNIAGRSVDLRVSTLPTQFGESVVLRVLDRTTVNLDLEMLGMPDYIHKYLLEMIERPNGIFIATGPTGSGKTTTLYSCLRKINTIDSKLLTAEEPVEYDLEGIIQVPVNENIGLTFARVLRAFLRQDPDRIMIGETRDLETAQIAIQASLTGHLVFTTLHTNDAPGAITRLIDMGVEPFLISATLDAVLGQRLLRSICPNCRENYKPNESLLAQLEISKRDIGDRKFFYGKGCDACNNTGYKGRKGIYELMKITDPLRELINERAPTVTLKQKAVELGMVTLRQDGLRSIFAGDTTIEEVLKYT